MKIMELFLEYFAFMQVEIDQTKMGHTRNCNALYERD